ncbi:hypothetical protein R1sor_020201 [Riccia sorocarpa]|uniref:Uncharacterized protein n=1 Tax=Riccia sorocarpa TaxID=122646 RepID=A0ABD3II11_9MARC
MESLPVILESCRMESLEIGANGEAPCKVNAVTKDTLCFTPVPKLRTPSPGTGAERSEAKSVPSSSKAEILAKPPLVPVRVLDIEHSETENETPLVEVKAKTVLPSKSEAVLKEMPFKERNREDGRRMIPPHIKVPPKKLFGYPEKYKSPTDAMVSPISKGLLARNRRPARTLAAPIVPPKALENTFQDVVVTREAGDVE